MTGHRNHGQRVAAARAGLGERSAGRRDAGPRRPSQRRPARGRPVPAPLEAIREPSCRSSPASGRGRPHPCCGSCRGPTPRPSPRSGHTARRSAGSATTCPARAGARRDPGAGARAEGAADPHRRQRPGGQGRRPAPGAAALPRRPRLQRPGTGRRGTGRRERRGAGQGPPRHALRTRGGVRPEQRADGLSAACRSPDAGANADITPQPRGDTTRAAAPTRLPKQENGPCLRGTPVLSLPTRPARRGGTRAWAGASERRVGGG